MSAPEDASKRLGPFRLRTRSVRLFYDIHSWVGVLAGLAFFVCCFSGTLALFRGELTTWERPVARHSPALGPALTTGQLFQIAQEHLGTPPTLFVALPTEQSGGLQAWASSRQGTRHVVVAEDSGEIVEVPGGSAFDFLGHLHTDLHLPRPYGRYLVGFLGAFMLLSLITGALAHPKALKDVFLLRWRPSRGLTFSDVHKQLGVWGLLFGLAMAFTGAVIGLLGLFTPLLVLAALGGDAQQADETLSWQRSEAMGVEARMLSVADLIETTRQANPDFDVTGFVVNYWGDEAAEVSLRLERRRHDQLAGDQTHRLSLVDGRVLDISSFTGQGLARWWSGALRSVHFASFAGLGLKLLYFVFGLGLAAGIATGAVIWFDRRKPTHRDGSRRHHLYTRFGRFYLGACLGLVIASTASIGAARFVYNWVEPVFWSCWLVTVVVALVVPSGARVARFGGWLTAGALMVIALVDLLVSPILTPAVVRVDVVLLSLGLVLGAGMVLLPRLARAAATEPGSVARQSDPAGSLRR